MTKISDLPRELVEDVLSRVPVTSLRAVRFTCTNWNTFSKDESFTKKHIGQANKKEFLVIMRMNSRLHLMSFDLRGLHKEDNVESSIQTKGTLISVFDGDRVVKHKVLHCDGLLLCNTRDLSKLVVLNPYCGQMRWIRPRPRNSFLCNDNYALGYEMKNKSYRNNKVLRFSDISAENVEFEIYNLGSNSWKVIEVTQRRWVIPYYSNGVTLKGNTYWSAYVPRAKGEVGSNFLLGFDFTKERFGPHLPLPCNPNIKATIIISSVREEQLAVLVQNWPVRFAEIWITNKIEPNAVSWGTKLFLQFYLRCPLSAINGSFFVDQKNKVAVLLYSYSFESYNPKGTRFIAYIHGEDNHYKVVDLREALHMYSFSFACSYVPSSVQVEKLAPLGKRKWSQVID